MIRRFLLLRNIGQFDSVDQGRDLPLDTLSLVYSENGRGKTTLAAIIRSLSTGDPLPVLERRRLGATAEPEVVLDLGDGVGTAVFREGCWTQTYEQALVFDERFVDANVYSGLSVEAEHRQRLHEVVLGSEAVELARRLQTLVERIEEHNRALRMKGGSILPEWLHGLSVDAFCELPLLENVDDRIAEAERNLAVSRDRELVRTTPTLVPLRLPAFDVTGLRDLLRHGVPALLATAGARLQQHFAHLGPGGERWVADGVRRAQHEGLDSCPFCGQPIGPEVIAHEYAAYFSDAYRVLVAGVEGAITEIERDHSGDAQASFEREVRVAGERTQFWGRYATVAPLEMDTSEIGTHWRAARDAVLSALNDKRVRPLDEANLSVEALAALHAYEADRSALSGVNGRIADAVIEVAVAKERAEANTTELVIGDLQRLRAAKSRQTEAAQTACQEYLDERAAKSATERERDKTKAQLDALRITAFPRYEEACNRYLERLNAEFRLAAVTSVNTRGGPAVTYNLVVNGRPVTVGGGEHAPGTPWFGTALSAGDRTTLAMALFLASLDADTTLANKVVVLDDPISSLDDQRTRATVREVRNLADRCHQLILLSHYRAFLCAVWDATDRANRTAVEISRGPTGSILRAWDVDADSATEHDRRHAVLTSYLRENTGNLRAVAQDLRLHLERYLRVTRPGEFPPATLIGPFLGRCRDRLAAADPILPQDRIDELQDLLDFANRFHHDTNPAWDTEPVTDGELRGMVERVLAFAS